MRVTVGVDDCFTNVFMKSDGAKGPASTEERLPRGGPGTEVIFAQERKFPIIAALAVDVKTGRRNDVYARANAGSVEPRRVSDAPIEGINFKGKAGGQTNFNGWSHDIRPRFIAVLIRVQEWNAAQNTDGHQLRGSNLIYRDRNKYK